MKTSPSQRSRKLLGSIVLGQRQSSLDECNELRDYSMDNKENSNNGTDRSCMMSESGSPKMVEQSATASNKFASVTKQNVKQTKDHRKISMSCSELFADSNIHITTNSNLSPTSLPSSTASFRGRTGSDLMKYSSLKDKSFIRVPSAKTISDRMLVTSASSSEKSPETKQILKEVESAYMSSPIPSSYKAKSNKQSKSASKDSRHHIMEEVENAYMSSPISKKKTEASSTKQPANASQMDSYVEQPLERKTSFQSLPDGRSSARSPMTVASGMSALAVEREKQQRKHDAENNNKGVNGRQNLDKRTARLRYGDAFKADILQHRANFPHLNNGSNHKDKSECEIQERGVNGVSAVVRKRPIFNYELDRGDFDIVSIDNTTENMDMCLIHNCVMHPDMKQMQMKLTCFPITAAFDEHCSDDDIYHHIAEPLVKIAASGGISTILMFGQTGERPLMH